MKNLSSTLLVNIIFLAACFAQRDTAFSVTYFNPSPHISIRALEVRSDSRVWFAANHGVWGFTEDQGKTWHIDSIKVDSVYPEFRSMAVLNDSTVLLLSISSPAYLFKTTNKGKTWKWVYKNTDKNIFFDSMKFWDEKNGIAIGDPIDSCFQLITTANGGETWKPIDCSGIPKAMEGESLFAASNTNIDLYGKDVWFATGGKHARIFHSADSGHHFRAEVAPIQQGGKMTGVFSVCIGDKYKIGIIAGGNYEHTDSTILNMAFLEGKFPDGRERWEFHKDRISFFGSCVQLDKNRHRIFITGHDGTFIKRIDSQYTLTEIKDAQRESLKFHTLRISPSGKTLWLAGDKGRIAFITLAP